MPRTGRSPPGRRGGASRKLRRPRLGSRPRHREQSASAGRRPRQWERGGWEPVVAGRLLIVVVVAMDFMSQVQTHLMSHQYESLMKKSNLQNFGRR